MVQVVRRGIILVANDLRLFVFVFVWIDIDVGLNLVGRKRLDGVRRRRLRRCGSERGLGGGRDLYGVRRVQPPLEQFKQLEQFEWIE